MKPIRLMLVGLGRWGRFWIEDIQNNAQYEIVALVGRRSLPEVREAVTSLGFDESVAFNDLETAITQSKPDAALIVVPPAEHIAVTLKCIEHNLHILSEKPLANTMAEAIELQNAAAQHGVHFMVAQDYRWQPPIQTLQQSIASGLIGKVRYVVYQHYQSLQRGGWRQEMDDALLEDMAIHHFDILRLLLGKDCQAVYAESFNPEWSWYKGGAATSVLLTFEGDVKVSYIATWVTKGPENSWPGEIRIEGDQGALLLATDGSIKLYQQGGERDVPVVSMAKTGRPYALEAFSTSLAERIPSETEITDNIKSYAMTRAAIESSRTHCRINLIDIFNLTNG